MGLILDTSLLIADERGKFDMPGFLRPFAGIQPIIAAVTASELLHGIERAQEPARKERRRRHVEDLLAVLFVQPFGMPEARVHAQIWAELASQGNLIGAHDLQIAATALAHDCEVATLNLREFQRVPGLKVVDATTFARS